MPTTQECPRLRPGLAAVPDRHNPQFIFLWDQLGLGRQPQRLNALEFSSVQMFNGRNSLRDIQAETMRQLGGVLLPLEFFVSLMERLDAALFLDGPRFQERLSSPIREPACIGTYPAEPEAVRRQLESLFTDPKGPGLPREPLRALTQPGSPLRAALIPHIDYHRGGHCFAWGFKEIFEQADASL